MTPFIYYQLKAGICIMLFTGLYYALFRKETFHKLNRIYLVFTLILSQLLPAIELPAINPAAESGLTQFVNAVTIYASKNMIVEQSGQRLSAVALVYGITAILLVMYLLYQIINVLVLIRQSGTFRLDKYRIISLPGRFHSFSFFNLIFISSSDSHSDDSKQILQHELAHAGQWHSLDIMLIQITKILQWFNPFIYLA